MITFDAFFAATKIYNKYINSTEAMAVFNFLKLEGSKNKMIESTKNGRPALEGVVEDLENIFKNNQKFDFNKDEVKQCIGKMVNEIMADYGYVPDEDMQLKGTIFFKGVMKYQKNI